MAQNFLSCDREQELLLPPSLREWLPEEHLAWFVLDAVAAMDLRPFYLAYRADGHGRAAHDPAMMVALLLYAYAVGERSSRAIERRCEEDVAFRVIAANQAPDHATVARFRVRHEDALAGLFGEVLALCARAGAIQVGVIAVDGTRMKADAADRANFSYEQLAREILAEADAVDAAEDAQFGERRGDDLPPELADRTTRKARLKEAKARLGAEHAAKAQELEDWQAAKAQHIARTGDRRGGWPTKPSSGPRYEQMRELLETEDGKQLYRRRQAIIEPVFAQTKITRRADRFQRRGLAACKAEWRLITATHNLLKLWRRSLSPQPA